MGTSDAQTSAIDSLESSLAHSTDTTRVNLLNKLSKSYWYIDPNKTIKYAAEAMTLAKDLNHKTGLTSAYNNTGVGYYQQNKYEEALQWYNKALGLHRETGNYVGEGYVLSNMGLIYWKQGALTTAVEYYLQTLKIWEDHKLENEMASVFDNLGNVYNEHGDYNRALLYYFKAAEIQKRYSNTAHERSMTLSNIGTAYLGKANNPEALSYFLKSLELLAEDEKESRAVSFSNIGLTYIELKDYTRAKDYLKRALNLQEEIEDIDGMIHTLLGLSKMSQQTGNLKESRPYASRALSLAIKINDLPVLVETWQILSDISASEGDHKSAYSYYRNYVSTKDSLTNKENIYKIAQLQAGFETQKKQAEIEALKKQRQQLAFKRNTIIGGLMALLIIAGLIVSTQRLRIRKNTQLGKINEQLVAQAEQLNDQTIRLRELDKAKSTFFANISHEFRTPLTLILNSLSDRISNVEASEDKSELEQLEVMLRNARRLLNLINQLLDLSKLESGHMKLSAENCNLNDLLKVVHGSFSSLSVSRQVKFSLAVSDEIIMCRLDIDKTEKILYNLLSNAFKFTPVNGSIEVAGKQVDNEIEVAVHNTGPGIPEDQLPHVFNRFYQGKQYYSDEQGTGIGLALTRELVELHGGKIQVESDQNRTCFTVRLPLVPVINDDVVFLTSAGQTHYDPALSTAGLNVDQKNYVAEPGQADIESPSVLIIEDNEDLRNYMKRNLVEKYQVIESENGKDGLEKAILFVPDLIITDWMMPEMDGLALCHHLKTDERTSHIPVIMVTALASDDAKFQGLETGADDYLTKPFDNRELNIRIRNLVDSRKLLRERFSRELHLGPKKVRVSSMDEIFLNKVMQTVETYLGDAEFSMEKFGQEVGLSRMQLHRKLKALTGASPGDFLRTTRLKRAKQLLESRAGNVSEVAYEVGFNNLSYFSKCYREQFGMTPNEAFSSHVTNPAGNVTG